MDTNDQTLIPTALHAWIDYGVATLFAAAATSRTLSPPVCRTLGAIGACHAAYSAATDYEGGLRPWITMHRHLTLDTLGGLALIAAGVAMRRQPAAERALLVAAGFGELGIIARSSGQPVHGPAYAGVTATYPPLDTLKPIGDGVFIVDSALSGLLGKVIPARMTVIRLADGSLLLHSPTRFTEGLRHELLQIGPVSHLVAPNIAHWTLFKPWQRAFPQAISWAAPGLPDRRPVRRSGLRFDHVLGDTAPAAWGETIELIMVSGGLGFHEAALFHRPSGTLVLTDLVINLEPAKVPAGIRPLLRLFGSMAPDGMPPPYVRWVVKLRQRAAAASVERMLALAPRQAVFAHGRRFDDNTITRLRHSFRWLLG